MTESHRHRFDPTLDRILDRVYGLELAGGRGRSKNLILADAAMARARRDMTAL